MWPAIAGLAGSVLGFLGQESQNDAMAEAAEGAGMPIWDPRQEARLFGGAAWNPQMPQVNADAMNYGNAMTGGYNPATGPQGPMNFEDMLSGLLGGEEVQGQGMSGLLGYGGPGAPSAAPPPLMQSNPYYGGANVDRPDNLVYNLYGSPVPNQQQWGQPAPPQQQVFAPQIPQGANYGGQADPRPGNYMDLLGGY